MHSFQSSRTALGALEAETAARIVLAAADVALILDNDGVIRDLAFGRETQSTDRHPPWVGQHWIDTVTIESRPKVEQILREAGEGAVSQSREVNQILAEGEDLPVKYAAIPLAKGGDIVVVGRELKTISKLQQRLIETQRTMERDYARLRHAETRYRQIFFLSQEAMLIVDASGRRITDVNPAATQVLGVTAGMVVGQPLQSLFSDADGGTLLDLIVGIRVSGRTQGIQARLATDGRAVVVSASAFRLDNAAHILIRLTPAESAADPQASPWAQRIGDIMRRMPDGFVVTDAEARIIETNAAFLDMVEITSPEPTRNARLDRWLGRPAVDINVLLANLREHGAVRDFGTVLHGEFGGRQEVEVTAAAALDAETPCMGFVIRATREWSKRNTREVSDLPRSVAQMTELVGRVSLKEIVRETTDVIERLCVEAALKLTNDNRASAAQMLGLSRQSLYGKLRRFDIGDLGGEPNA